MKDIDIKDSPILACALSIPNEGIWTEDKDFEKQTKIPIWKTKVLKEYVKNRRKQTKQPIEADEIVGQPKFYDNSLSQIYDFMILG